jgi:hypothetical protein
MSVNSISPGQSAKTADIPKKTEVAAARKQTEIQQANLGQDRKMAAEHQSQIQEAPASPKPSVNTSGQKIGTHINISA